MPEYKLYYFDCRGFGDVIRQLFKLGNIPFEDIRISDEEWPEYKEKMPFGRVPVLEVDGQQIPESIAITRYVAKTTGHTGKTPIEEALVDGLADQFKDYYEEIRPYFYSAMDLIPLGSEKEEKAKKELFIPARDKFFGYLTKYLKKNPSGFLVGDGLTFADLIVVEHISIMKNFYPQVTDGFPEVEALIQKVHGIPVIKEWIETRPKNQF